MMFGLCPRHLRRHLRHAACHPARRRLTMGKMSIIGGAIIAVRPRRSFSPFINFLASTSLARWRPGSSNRQTNSRSAPTPIRTPLHRHQRRVWFKGRTWGLEGGLFWWLIGGIGSGIIVFCPARDAGACPSGMSFLARSCTGVRSASPRLRVAAGQASRL